jgi:hypothetical protein
MSAYPLLLRFEVAFHYHHVSASPTNAPNIDFGNPDRRTTLGHARPAGSMHALPEPRLSIAPVPLLESPCFRSFKQMAWPL